jgi:hypothetical protein
VAGSSVETMTYLASVARQIKTAGVRVGEGDEYELAALMALHDEVEAALVVACKGQLGTGRHWSDIARGTGLTKAGAWKRWGGKTN